MEAYSGLVHRQPDIRPMRSRFASSFAVAFVLTGCLAWANWQVEQEQRELSAQGLDRSLLLLAERVEVPEVSSMDRAMTEGPRLGESFIGRESLAAIRGWPEVEGVFPVTWQEWEYETIDGGREPITLLGVHRGFVADFKLGDARLLDAGAVVFAGPPPTGLTEQRLRLHLSDEALQPVLAQIPDDLHQQIASGSSSSVRVSTGTFKAFPGGSGGQRMAYLDRLHSALPGLLVPAERYIVRLHRADQVDPVMARLDRLFTQDRPTPQLKGRAERMRDAFPRSLSGTAVHQIARWGAILLAVLVAALVFMQLAVDARRNGLELALRRAFGNSVIGSIRDTLERPLRFIAGGALSGALVGSVTGHAFFPSEAGPSSSMIATLGGVTIAASLFLSLALWQVTRSPFLTIRQHE